MAKEPRNIQQTVSITHSMYLKFLNRASAKNTSIGRYLFDEALVPFYKEILEAEPIYAVGGTLHYTNSPDVIQVKADV